MHIYVQPHQLSKPHKMKTKEYTLDAHQGDSEVFWRWCMTQDYWVFGLCPSSGILKKHKKTMFRKLEMFPSSDDGWETPTL
jgi:hypothetical protein